MSAEYDFELRMAVAEGFLFREEAEAVRAEAARLGRNPLELLVERGRLSSETLASLRRAAPREPACDTGEPHDDSTLDVPPREAHGTGVPGFPVSGWTRYHCLRLLGQGGMGRVFLAHDTQLRRDVALKFVRDDDPDHMRRFIFEARSQARVSHERVCQVFEVGEVQGKTYIAMQYIDGVPLSQLSKELTLEQKILVMREVAEGVHAAHRAGLIHRDIKPSNIMVERTDSGLLKPYVMDFGLARDWKEGMTATGSVMGTPHYMAPEQARGEVARLDRRADVYSLGATLYHVLTGVLPIPGSNSLEVLSNISTLEPRPPRALDKDIPADLEAITLKCMEKERSARYDSARVLSEELERFLNGEPVLARSPGLWYRLRKRARKHKAVVAVSSVALVLLMMGLGLFGLELRAEKRRSDRRVRDNQMLTAIENLARHPYLLPLHDTSAERKRIHTLVRELEAELHETRGEEAAAIHYVLGRGYQALGEERKAKASLEAAWNGGLQTPQVAYAQALVLSQLYQRELLEEERVYRQRRGTGGSNSTAAERQHAERKQKLQREYRDNALARLKRYKEAPVPLQQVSLQPVPPQYVEALLAYNEDRFEEALAHLDTLGPEWLGFYAALVLRGDIHLASAVQHWNQGRPVQAQEAFDAGRRAYVQAADIARSDPSVHLALARLESAVVDMEVDKSRAVQGPFERGLQAVTRSLEAAPDHYEALVLQARLYRRLAQAQASEGQDTQEAAAKALEAAQAARGLAPERPEAWLELGRAYWRLGRKLLSRNEDPRERLREALESLEHVAPEDRGDEFHHQLGLIHGTWADYETLSGLDALPGLDKAIDSYRRVVQGSGGFTAIWINLASVHLARARQRNNPDPSRDLEQAREALDKARAGNPHQAQLVEFEGMYHEQLARWTRRRGGDARPHWEKVLVTYQRGLLVHEKSEFLRISEGQALVQLALEAWDHGGDPSPWFARAQASFEKVRLLAPGKSFSYSNLGLLHARRAAFQLARGENPLPNVRAAQEAYRQALERAPLNAQTWVSLGRSFLLRAAFELEQGRDPGQSLVEASGKIHHALGLNSRRDPEALASLAEVRGLEARWRARPEDFAAAEATFQSALALNPSDDQDIRLAFGRFYRDQASWRRKTGRDPLPSLEQGLVLANGLLAERPRWADALLLRASLTLSRLEVVAHPERQALDQARKDIDQALESNRNLDREAGTPRSRSRKLLGERGVPSP